ncbi:MAG: hypothetical protein EXR71_06740 [Myxococcales bacterium]|nr:hypothetical protein [Myxococcales bacterium]
MVLLLTLACAPSEESEPLLYDAARTGLEGANGPWGVHLRTADGGEDPPTDIFWATDAAGARADVGFAAATLVLIQGAGVGPTRYHWLAVHFASRGATVLVPHHGLDAADLDLNAGVRALAAATDAGDVDATAPVGVLGHGLGGEVASTWWAADEAVGGLALLGAAPSAVAAVEDRPTGSVISIVGSADDVTGADGAAAGLTRFNLVRAGVTVAEFNHYDWADFVSADEQARDGAPAADQAAARQDAQWALAGWVDSCLTSSVGTWPFYRAAHDDLVDGDPCELMVMGG